MQVDLDALRKCLPEGTGHVSLEVRDREQHVIVTLSLDFPEESPTNSQWYSPTENGGGTDPEEVGENFLSILT